MAKNSQNFYALSRKRSWGKKAPTAIDLFSGAGGITLGLLNAVDAVRISQSARDTIFLNSKAHSPVRFGDGKSFAGLRLGEWLER